MALILRGLEIRGHVFLCYLCPHSSSLPSAVVLPSAGSLHSLVALNASAIPASPSPVFEILSRQEDG